MTSHTTFDGAEAQANAKHHHHHHHHDDDGAAASSPGGAASASSSSSTVAAAAKTGPVFSGTLEEERRVYDFMTRHDIPKFVDNICQHLLRTTPADPQGSVISMLTGQKNGMHHGGTAVAGHNVHGGWILCFSQEGKLMCSINHLKGLPNCTHELLNNATVDQGLADAVGPTGSGSAGSGASASSASGSALSGPSAIGTSLMACALGERALYVICSPPEGSSQSLIDLPPTTSAPSSAQATVTHFVCKFSTDTGQLLRAMSVPRQPITLHVDRERGYVWVGYRHGGVGILHARGGNNMLGDIHTPIALALHATPTSTGSVWVLTPRQIERRQWETGQLLMSIDLPNMLNSWPCSFSVARQHLYVSAPNPDGTAAFVGMFDIQSGEPLRTFVPGGTGCLLSVDHTLGGVWLLQRASSSNAAACFHSDFSGVKTMACDVGRAKAIAYQVDQSSSRLWIARVSMSEDSKLLLIDPFRGEIIMEASLPSCVSGSCPTICAL